MRFALPLSLALTTLLATATAHAGPPDNPRDRKGYVLLSPGLIYVPVGDDDFTDLTSVGYQWGVSGGAMFGVGDSLGITAGMQLQHAPMTVDRDLRGDLCGDLGDCRLRFHLLRLAPEVRVGGAVGPVFIYGLVAPGVAIISASFTGEFLGQPIDERDSDAGFGLGLAAGAQGFVWQSLSLGGELGFDMAFFNDENASPNDPAAGQFGAHNLVLRLLLGWWF